MASGRELLARRVGSVRLRDLSDVATTTYADGDIPTYDAASDTFIPTAGGGGSGISDGDKGDITVTSSGTVWTIDNGAVTNAKLASGIDAAKLSGGTVSNAEFDYLNGVTSAIQTQLDAKQPLDSDLTTIAGLPATTDNFIQAKSSAWASRTPTQVTADLIAFVGDSGSGGTKGLVPAPASGDAAANKYLKANGSWDTVSGGGGVSDGDKGDITVSGSGATWTIDNDAVTYAKIQNISAQNRILARKTSGAGDVEECTVSEILDMAGTAAKGDRLVRSTSSWSLLPEEVIDITAAPYSAVGDGVTNNYTVINNAITAAKGTGKPVYIPKGEFYIGTTLTIDDSIIIIGDGEQSILLNDNGNEAIIWDCAWGSEIAISDIQNVTLGTDAVVTRLRIPLNTISGAAGGSHPMTVGKVGKIWSNNECPYVAVMSSTQKNYMGENFTIFATSSDGSYDYIYCHGKLKGTFTTTPKLRMLPQKQCVMKNFAIEANGDIFDNAITSRKDAVRIYGAVDPQIDLIIKSAWRAGINMFSCDGGKVRQETRLLHNNPTAGAYGYGAVANGSTRGLTIEQAQTRAARHGQTTDILKTTAFSDSDYKLNGVPFKVSIPYAKSLGSFGTGIDTHEGAIETHYGEVYVSGDRRNVDTSLASLGTIKGKGFQDRGEGTMVDFLVISDASEGVSLNSQTYPFGRDATTYIGTLILNDVDGFGVEVDCNDQTTAFGQPYSASMAINNGAGYAAGTTTINVDGATGSAVLQAGDFLVIDGHCQRYKVTAQNTASSGAFSSVTIRPGLQAAVADNAVVKAWPNQSRVVINNLVARNVGKVDSTIKAVVVLEDNASVVINNLIAHDLREVVEMATTSAGDMTECYINGGRASKMGTSTTDEPFVLRSNSICSVSDFVVDYGEGATTRSVFRGKTSGNSLLTLNNLTVIPVADTTPPSICYSNTSGHNMAIRFGSINCSNANLPIFDADSGGVCSIKPVARIPQKLIYPSDTGDASVTVNAGIGNGWTRYAAAITADRTVTMAKFADTVAGSKPYDGQVHKVSRESTATGAFNVLVKSGAAGTTIATLSSVDQYCEVIWDETGGEWRLLSLTTNGSGSGVSDGDKGDITVSGSGSTWTIDNGVVTYAKIQDVSATSRIMGRITAGAGDMEELTGAQTTSLLSNFVGDSGSGGTKGLVPAPASGDATKYLKGDGTWAAVATLSDGDKGDITVSSSGTVWTVDNDSITYAKLQNISATSRFLGRITAGAGDAEELTGTQATSLLDNMVGDSGSGGTKGLAPAPASGDAAAGKFLKADGTWAVPSGGGGVSDGDKGDITVSSSGTAWTIDNDVVTYAKMQNVSATSRILGRITSGAGDVEELTGTQTTTLLDAFVGDSGSGGTKGVVPAPASGDAGKVLTGDGTFEYRLFDLAIHAAGNSNLTYTSMSAAVSFLNGDYRTKTKLDLTNFTQCRIVIQMRGTAGAAGSKLIARYRTTDSTTASDFSDIGTSEVSATIDANNTITTSSWINLASGAKADVFVVVVGSGGDGATSPTIGSIHLQFR